MNFCSFLRPQNDVLHNVRQGISNSVARNADVVLHLKIAIRKGSDEQRVKFQQKISSHQIQ